MSVLYSLLLCVGLPTVDDEVLADYLLRGALIYDGSGRKGEIGDVAIRGERIVAVGKFKAIGKLRVIDAKGLIVAPGFIDLHTHSDEA
jgi:N-acyl-D-amino-acid deacylase